MRAHHNGIKGLVPKVSNGLLAPSGISGSIWNSRAVRFPASRGEHREDNKNRRMSRPPIRRSPKECRLASWCEVALPVHGLHTGTRPELFPLFLGHRLVADDTPAEFFVLEIGKRQPTGSARQLHVASGSE